ncbi:hypothetical protein Poly30_48060 [Planctomycetes bacterium Poly30]|uniref:Uncharacterized protein n=1 Tax=Saltatorellus ferox TaxID=2528018 RepID=A0A518EYS9_9BACT|nr:hypothetical protein Poly30_48060 [Planctomycetes bacterium Poly30]
MDSDFHLNGKGVTLINVSAQTWRPELITIRNIQLGSTVVARGLRQDTGHLSISSCRGAVLVTDCTLADSSVRGSRSVSFTRCDLVADPSFDSPHFPYYHFGDPGLRVEDSSVLLEDCHLSGADSSGASCGSGFCQTCCTGGSSGHSALSVFFTSDVRAQTCTLEGGAAGSQGGCNCPTYSVGFGYSVEAGSTLVLLDTPTLSSGGDVGSATVLPDTPRGMTLPQSVAASSTFSVDVRGEPGDTVFLLSGGDFGFRSSALTSGILQIHGSTGRRRIQSLSPSGQATVTLLAPSVQSGQVVGLPIQLAFLRPNGQVRFAPAGILDVRGLGVPTW